MEDSTESPEANGRTVLSKSFRVVSKYKNTKLNYMTNNPFFKYNFLVDVDAKRKDLLIRDVYT